VFSLQETHILSPQALNTFTAGFSRAAFNYDSFPLASFPHSLDFVTGLGPGGVVIGGGATTTGIAALTAAGPNNAANVWNRRNLFTYTDSLQINKGIHQISAGVWFQRLRDNENTASRQLGQASFASLQTFLQGTVTTFQAVTNPNELGWRSLFGAWYFEDTIKLRPNLTLQAGIRHEFTTGWNEVSGRAANYITDANGILQTNTRVSNATFTENNAKRLFGPRIGLAWDPFGKERPRSAPASALTIL
jgi:outer membrane receptor for monomeric catechols